MDKIVIADHTIDMEPLKKQSSTIKDIGYSIEGRLLVVRFISGSIYCYSPITPHAYRELLDAESVGSYIQRNIVKNKLVNAIKLEAK